MGHKASRGIIYTLVGLATVKHVQNKDLKESSRPDSARFIHSSRSMMITMLEYLMGTFLTSVCGKYPFTLIWGVQCCDKWVEPLKIASVLAHLTHLDVSDKNWQENLSKYERQFFLSIWFCLDQAGLVKIWLHRLLNNLITKFSSTSHIQG